MVTLKTRIFSKMGKKAKTGKQRRDKYYFLAKETGFRSRAAFKLIQLNKRFEFLQTSRAVVDLCAAPGGWMQVAVQNMPVSSICIGVDLSPIKPISSCIALQGDITTEKTRQAIKKELQTWEADTVLHDGAPNVGMNWIHDAFQQNCLVLSALKLATQILRKGGTFVTKIFRSNDYHFLISTFEKLFKKVNVWKPAASRLESAEIFVVCQKYHKPAKVDPDLLDPKKVFLAADLNPEKPDPQKLLLHRKKEKKPRAEGYAEGEFTMHHEVTATQLVDAPNYLEILAGASKILLDQEMWEKAEQTTQEVRDCMADVKVLGPRELRLLIKWRKAMNKLRDETVRKEAGEEEEDEDMEVEDPDEKEDAEMAELDRQIAQADASEKSALKKKKKKMLREKAKVLKRRQLKMVIEGDEPDIPIEQEIFSLQKIRKMKELAMVSGDNVSTPAMEEDDDDEEGLGDGEWEEREGADSDSENDGDSSDEDNDLIHNEETGLTKDEKAEKRSENWFAKEELAGLLGGDDEDEEELAAVEKHLASKQRANGKVIHNDTVTFDDKKGKKKKKATKVADEDDGLDRMEGDEPVASAFNDEDDLSSDEEFEDEDKKIAKRKSEEKAAKKQKLGEDGQPLAKKRRLTAEQLAIGEQLIHSSKTRRDLEDWGWHKFMNNDEELPDWFVDDERKHYVKHAPITKAQVAAYRERLKEMDARPIKKATEPPSPVHSIPFQVAQAKARKQRRIAKRMDKAKKRAENIVENENLEHSEKIKEMKKIYKKAELKEKKDVTYQVVTKGKSGRMARPQGPYKKVDARMKADNRKQKAQNRAKSWKEKSTKEKKSAQEKKRKHSAEMKAGRTANRRMKRGKPV